jgi:hypothetical protein
MLPLGTLLLAPAPARRVLKRLVSHVGVPHPASGRRVSWGHARLEWDDGTCRDGWLRVGEGYAFTARVAAHVARRLLDGEGRPGAFTPGALFRPELAEQAGGEFILDRVEP